MIIEQEKIKEKNSQFLELLLKHSNKQGREQVKWIPENNFLLSSYPFKKDFSNMAYTIKMTICLKVQYKGFWLSYLNNQKPIQKSTLNFYNDGIKQCLLKKPINTIVNKHYFLKLTKYDYVYCLLGINFNNNNVNIWSHILQSKNQEQSMYKTYLDKVNILDIFTPQYFPFYFNIDSEFKDLVKPNTSPYDNLRDRIPASLTVVMTNMFNYQKKRIHFVFEEENYKHLKQHNPQENFMLAQYQHNNNNSTNLKVEKDIINLDKQNPLFLLLQTIYTSLNNKINFKDSSLRWCAPNNIKKDKNFRNCYILKVYNYFSAKDYHYFLGRLGFNIIEPYLESRRVLTFEKSNTISPFGFIYKNNNTTLYFKLQIVDISGICQGGLTAMADLTNITVKQDNHLLNKEDIFQTLIKNPQIYIKYSTQDTEPLDFMACQCWVNLIEVYELFNVKNIPTLINYTHHSKDILNYMKFTSGSNIATFFKEYIYSLDPHIKDTLEILAIKADNFKCIEGISMGSSRYLNYLSGHALIGAFVSGGRCINERNLEQSFSNGADIDLSSCYGTSIKNLSYPIGIPSVLRPLEDYDIDENNKYISSNEIFVGSLKNVMKNYRQKLVPGFWYAVVSTNEPLSFSFDLLVSKNINLKNIIYKESTSEFKVLSGDQLVLTREVKNAILTQPLLDIIDKVSSRSEKKELYEKLHIKVMVFYDKKHQCKTYKEFNLNTVKETIKIKMSNDKHNKDNLNKDSVGINSFKKKPLCWIDVPIEGFIDTLLNKRKGFQKQFKETGENIYNSKQIYIKLVINMIYGITASKYFDVSNLCFANNITSLARSSVWIMAKSLNLCQTITDGGLYELNNINYWHEISYKRKPGFNQLTVNKYNDKIKKPLGYQYKIDWTLLIEEKKPNLNQISRIADTLALKHIHKFLEYFKLNLKHFPYNVEHKPKNFFKKATTLNRGHYALYSIDNKFLYKVRGTQQKEGLDHVTSPIFEILKAKMFHRNAVINNICYTKSSLVKSNDLEVIRRRHPYLEINLHDQFINKMTLKVKKDDGKYRYLKDFKHYQSLGNSKEEYEYLDSKYFVTDQNPCLLKNEFWENYYNKKIKESKDDYIPIYRRNSKKSLETIKQWINNATTCDSNFEPVTLSQFSKELQNIDYINQNLQNPTNSYNLLETDTYYDWEMHWPCIEPEHISD